MDIQPTTAIPTPIAFVEAPRPADMDGDYAFGFECAVPMLQIEAWNQEVSGGDPH
ncbi:hypothetical protein [Ramlibacter sp.]|uniref:hypothetical protein n=1 Tax=Ramlibacter sp. TaxID=1917967 RepID=UPI003D1496B7